MTVTALPPKLKTIAQKVDALRKLTATTGFQTNRSQGELMGRLSADELAQVALALAAE